MKRKLLLAAAAIALLAPASAQQKAKVDPALVDKYIASGFKSAPPEWQARFVQDETQKVCTEHRNQPPNAVVNQILEREKAKIMYPHDGQFLGDWKKGERSAQSGYGWRFTDADTSRPNGGNCYACHQIEKKELSFGTIGPSLAEYGKVRKFAPAEAKALYERIYNSNSASACSNMPRFGVAKFLTPEQIKDIVAYLMSPDSPVNK